MKTSLIIQAVRGSYLSIGFASLFSFSASAGVYPFSSCDHGAVPQGGGSFSSAITVSSISIPSPYITSFELILTFQDNASLTGTSGGIQGLLNLAGASGSPFVSFMPTAATPAGPNYVYDITFSGTSGSPGTGFYGINPNDTWGLVLWDANNNGFENSLVGWSLNITAVPEPVNVAMAVFGVVVVGVGTLRHYFKRLKEVSR